MKKRPPDPLPTGELLCRALRQERLDPLAEGEWTELLHMAQWQGLPPLLRRRLKAVNPPPEPVEAELTAAHNRSATRNMRLYYDLAQLLGPLRAANIPVIALKGAWLAATVYEDIALRPMLDIDLLVRRETLDRAETILLNRGYTPLEENPDLGQYHRHFVYRPPQGEIPVEIHWHIKREQDPLNIEAEELWQSAGLAKIAGCDTLVLSPEKNLLHVAMHAAYDHAFAFGLKPLVDIAEITRSRSLNWADIESCAARWGVGKAVYLALALAGELLNAPIPPESLIRLQPPDFDPQVRAWAIEQIFNTRPMPEALSKDFARLWQAETGPNRLKILWQKLLPPRQIIAARYPVEPRSRRLYLYYPVRWKDLLFHHSRLAWQMVRGEREAEQLVELQNHKTALQNWLR